MIADIRYRGPAGGVTKEIGQLHGRQAPTLTAGVQNRHALFHRLARYPISATHNLQDRHDATIGHPEIPGIGIGPEPRVAHGGQHEQDRSHCRDHQRQSRESAETGDGPDKRGQPQAKKNGYRRHLGKVIAIAATRGYDGNQDRRRNENRQQKAGQILAGAAAPPTWHRHRDRGQNGGNHHDIPCQDGRCP